MITRTEFEQIKNEAAEILEGAGVAILPNEIEAMEVADFGLSEVRISGAQILNLVDTEQIGVKLVILMPNQTLPEHRHPRIGKYPGKEEAVRCEFGMLYVNGPGERTPNPKVKPPKHRMDTYTVWHEYALKPGEQVNFEPGTPHWFQAGPDGAVFWSFSTKAIDVEDVFSDPEIVRVTVIADE